jgi:hypothetical protein
MAHSSITTELPRHPCSRWARTARALYGKRLLYRRFGRRLRNSRTISFARSQAIPASLKISSRPQFKDYFGGERRLRSTSGLRARS